MRIHPFMQDIKNEQRRIQRLIDLTSATQPAAEEGHLHLEQRGSRIYCYETRHQNGKRISKRYLGVPWSAAVQSHVQARFREERLQRLAHDSQLLTQMASLYQDYSGAAVLDALPKSYRTAAALSEKHASAAGRSRTEPQSATILQPAGDPQLAGGPELAGNPQLAGGLQYTGGPQLASGTEPSIAPDAQPAFVPYDVYGLRYEKLRQWANAPYEKNTAPFSDAATYAKDGTRVRSKGECLHYNQLQELGLLFRYDCILEIVAQNGMTKKVSPDFLIRCLDGKLLIIEHLGRMDDKGYAIDFGEKCYWYLQAGYKLGENLFVTSDDLHGGTDSRMIMDVDRQVQRRFFGL